MTDEIDELLDRLGAPEDDGPDEDAFDEEAFRQWYAHLPDFIRHDYPFDIPPYRLPAVRAMFDVIRTWRFCPDASCRRGQACRGANGPACFRADRGVLSEVLFVTWLRLFWDMPDEEWQRSVQDCARRYVWEDEPSPARAKGGPRRSGRRGAREARSEADDAGANGGS